MIHVIITGAAGRMGGRLISLVHDSQNLTLHGAIESRGHPSVGKDAGEVAGCGQLGITIGDHLAATIPKPVVVDFTTPSATLNHVRSAAQQQWPMVIGTTGFSPEELDVLRQLTQTIPCVLAPNMSVGINVLLQMIGDMAQALGDQYDIEVIEAHHHKKKDAPSGTALKIAEVLANAMGWNLQDVAAYARHGMIGERPSREIGLQTVRAGDIVGDHTIIFGGLGERVEITHRAHNRDPFARGALRAAEWVVDQSPGLYNMAHVLGLQDA